MCYKLGNESVTIPFVNLVKLSTMAKFWPCYGVRIEDYDIKLVLTTLQLHILFEKRMFWTCKGHCIRLFQACILVQRAGLPAAPW